MKRYRVLITGHRGFIGRNLARFLQSHAPRVHIVGHEDPIPFDDLSLLKSFLRDCRPEAIFHLASHKGEASGTAQPLLEALLQVKSSSCVVLPGSAAEYGKVPLDQLPVKEEFPGQPLSPYGLAKASQTRWAKEYARSGLRVVTARIFNVIGKDAPEHTLIGALLSKIRAAGAPSGHKTVAVGDLDIRRDFVDIEDVCHGLALLAQFGKSGEVYNICSGYSVALHRVLQQMITATGTSMQVLPDSPRIAKNLVLDIRGSIEKTRAATGWFPRYRWDEAVSRIFR
jgi:GDP-4-dehydro-6-deoxy-D-mannose reductase